MSRENVEILRQAFERFQRGGASADAIPVEIWAEDVEWDNSGYPLADMPDRGTGRDDFLSHLAGYFSGWTDYQPEVKELIDAGENVVVVLHERVRIRDSGVFAERDLVTAYTFRDGLVAKYRTFQTRAEALEAVGL